MKGQYLTRPQTLIKIALLGYNGDVLFDRHGVGGNVHAHNMSSATRWYHTRSQDANSCGFAGAIGAEQTKNLAALHSERNIVHRINVNRGFRIVLDKAAHLDSRDL